jgi:two-component system KDP operon response regulator KdpE
MTKEKKLNKNILIVEDDNSLRLVLKDKLNSEGFNVFEAENGEIGLDMALRNHPDLIILDIIMPKMDGNTMLERLREDAWGKSAKVVVLTNLDSLTDVAKIMVHNAFEYFIKSDIKVEDLVSRIKEKILD